MAVHAQDLYGTEGSVPAVTPQGGGGTPMSVRADASDFGGQVGGALQQVGGQIDETADKFRGMIFETAANNSEVDYIKQAGALTGKFRTLEGSAAQAALPQYQQDMTDLRQSIRSNLPGGAARMFDAVTTKHEAYAISDAYSYGASQVKKATLDSNNAVAETAVSRAGDISVASDDARFGSAIGDIKHSVASMMELQGYGAHTLTDPKTGKVSFDDTPEGKQASAVYQSELEKRTSAAWENRLHVLADANVEKAYKTYQASRGDIPGEAQVKLDAFFTPKVKDYQARNLADTTLGDYDRQYKDTVLTPKAGQMSIDDAIHMQESSGKAHDYQIQPGTFAQYAKPGEAAANPKDQDAVYGRIMDDLKKTYPDDPARQAVAYFSGKGNVAPAGSATPYVQDRQDGTGKTVSSYVSDILKRTTASAPSQVISDSLVPSQADFYRTNYHNILDDARTQAQAQHPDDPNYADTAVAKVEQRMNNTIRGQELAYKADNDTVVKAVNGAAPGKGATSVEQLRATSPDVAAAWDRLTVNNPIAAEAIEKRLLTANTKGDYNTHNPVGYSATEDRLFLPRTDPKAITSEAQLWPLVADKTITPKDRDDLAKMMGGMQNPKDAAEATLKKNVVDSALNTIMPAKMRTLGTTPEVDARMQNARIAIQLADEDAIKAGKTAQQRYSPDSRDFIGNAAKPFLPTAADKLSVTAKPVTPSDDAGTVKDLTDRLTKKQATLTDIQSAFKGNKITKATAIKLASDNGLIRTGTK